MLQSQIKKRNKRTQTTKSKRKARNVSKLGLKRWQQKQMMQFNMNRQEYDQFQASELSIVQWDDMKAKNMSVSDYKQYMADQEKEKEQK